MKSLISCIQSSYWLCDIRKQTLISVIISVLAVVQRMNVKQLANTTIKLLERFLLQDLMCLTNKKVKHFVNSARNKVNKLIRAVKYVYDVAGLVHDCTGIYVKT